MSEQAVNALLTRFGTTVEDLVPKVVAYETHMNVVMMWLSAAMIVVGALLLAWGAYASKNSTYCGDDGLGRTILGTCMFGLGICMLVGFAISQHAWSYAPEVSAYRAILGWLGG